MGCCAWRNGLWGVNGGLAALGTVPVGLLLQRLLAPRGLFVLSLPFITMLWCVLGLAAAMGWQIPTAHAAVTLAAPTALSAALAGTGLPALTLPFVVVVWVVLRGRAQRH